MNDIVKLFDGLRVSDVRDGLDWIGLEAKGSVNRDITPIFEGAKLCGQAFTVRSVPSSKVPPHTTPEEYTEWARGYWYKEVLHSPWDTELQRGEIVVMESPDLNVGEVGSWNSLAWHIKGAAGIVTSGGLRDRDECRAQGIPIFARFRSQSMTQGRVEYESAKIPVTIGGVLINHGDIVLGDSDGVIAVPLEHAEEVATYARQENENDKAGRRKMYETLGWALDDSVR